MTREDFLFLASEEGRRLVEKNISADPLKVALDKKLPHAALVATQVKYLARAKDKLPSYHAARCIIPSLAYEQSTAEAVAASREYRGELCIDLTCGLGVDSLYFAKHFEKVIAIERDPLLSDIARYNFGLLGADNIEVMNDSAERFIDIVSSACPVVADPSSATLSDANSSPATGLIFADPDRRGTMGRKLYRLKDCAPDMEAMMPQLIQIALAIVIKCSPLFDVDAPRQLFGDHTLCRVVSLGGECKEVIIEVGKHIPRPQVEAFVVGRGAVRYDAVRSKLWSASPDKTPDQAPRSIPLLAPELSHGLYKYLIIPDVALQKSRTAVDYFSSLGAYIDSDNGYAFSSAPLETPFGRMLRIGSIEKYAPKLLTQRLKKRGIKRMNILCRNFPVAAAEIARKTGVAEGGEHTFAFTRLGNEPVMIEIT